MTLTRRFLLAGTTLTLAAPLAKPASAQTSPSATPNAGAQAPGFYRYTIGDVEVTAIHDGLARFPLEGFVRNAKLPDVQGAMRDAFLPADALPITFTALVLRR